MFNLISWNVNSIRKRKRRVRLHECVKIWKPDILLLQETRLEDCDARIISQIWGKGNCGWCAINSVGFSCGILIIWNKSTIEMNDSIIEQFSIRLKCKMLLDERSPGFMLLVTLFNVKDYGRN